MHKIKKYIIFIINLLIINGFLISDEADSLINHNNDAWKVSLVPIAYGIPSLGQFQNNKPLKGISLMAMKSYWYNEYNDSKKDNNISDRNRAFWWFSFLYLYSIIDAYIDSQMETFPEEDENNIKEDK